MATGEKQEKKGRRIRFIILACLVLIPALTYLETLVFSIEKISFPVSGNVLVFFLININVLLLLLMVFLVLRRIAELIFERRQQLLGSKLRTKLVVSFISLSLIPTALLFFIALQFVSTSMDYWFNSNVDQSLQESLYIAKNIYQEARKKVKIQGRAIAKEIEAGKYQQEELQDLDIFFSNSLAARGLEGLELVSDQRQREVAVLSETLSGQNLPELPPELIRRALAGEQDQFAIQNIAAGDLVRNVTPVKIRPDGSPGHLLITSCLIPREQLERMEIISKGIEGYGQLMLLKNPIKTSLLVMLLIVTLLIIFSAVWFGFYVAQGLTGPIGKLADATKRVAEGELDFVIQKDSDDEMGMLVDSFNRMTRDLRTSNQQLEEANLALRESNLELDNRRQYTETILQNVAAGVISFDKGGLITTFNRFAEELLKTDRETLLNKNFRQAMSADFVAVIDDFIRELAETGKSSVQHPVRLTVGAETYSLLVNITRLENEDRKQLGMVLVFDNLTQLEKAQRMAAWREVAKRIAHEVKNPLTPIQLSAQRLRKKYLEQLGGDGEVFDLCTRTIVNQVDELKRLVSEFSNFARMPAVQISPNNLPEMVKDVLVLYEEAHKNVRFIFDNPGNIPVFNFDLKQMRRVLINLLDNAVNVLPEAGTVEINLSFDQELGTVYMAVSDDGPGVKEEDKPRLFEPYFSTKKSGTGLGLAIASTVITDHGGYIKVKDNKPAGTRFIVELPVNT